RGRRYLNGRQLRRHGGQGRALPWPRLSGATPVAILLSLLQRRLAEPLAEPDVAESRLAPRNQRPFTEFGPEVPRVRIGDNLAGVVVRGEALTDQFVETELLRTGQFYDAVEWGTHGDRADCLRDVLSCHRLKEHGWHPARRSDGGVIRHAFDELEVLRGG